MSVLFADSIGVQRVPTKSVSLHTSLANSNAYCCEAVYRRGSAKGFPWISMSGPGGGSHWIPKESNEHGFPFLHFLCKFMRQQLGCGVGSRTCHRISVHFDVGPGGGFHWAPTESNEVGFPLLHFPCKFMRHLLGCGVGSRTCQRISMDFDVAPGGAGFQCISTISNEIG